MLCYRAIFEGGTFPEIELKGLRNDNENKKSLQDTQILGNFLDDSVGLKQGNLKIDYVFTAFVIH